MTFASKENGDGAALSVLRCIRYFPLRRIHIVKSGFVPDDHFSNAIMIILTENKVELMLHGSKLKLDQVDPLAIVHISPDHWIHPSAIDRLLVSMKDGCHRHSQFAVATNVIFSNAGGLWNPATWLACAAYGFLNVLLVLDVFRSLLNLTKYQRTNDLRAETLSVSWPHKKVLIATSRWAWLLGTGVNGTCPAEEDAQQKVPRPDGGMAFVFRSIYTRWRSTRFSILWIFFCCVYYIAFSYPWWNSIVASTFSKQGYMYWLLYRDVWNNSAWQVWYILHTCLVGTIGSLYMTFPIRTLPATLLLYSFYLAVFPVVYVLGFFGAT